MAGWMEWFSAWLRIGALLAPGWRMTIPSACGVLKWDSVYLIVGAIAGSNRTHHSYRYRCSGDEGTSPLRPASSVPPLGQGCQTCHADASTIQGSQIWHGPSVGAPVSLIESVWALDSHTHYQCYPCASGKYLGCQVAERTPVSVLRTALGCLSWQVSLDWDPAGPYGPDWRRTRSETGTPGERYVLHTPGWCYVFGFFAQDPLSPPLSLAYKGGQDCLQLGHPTAAAYVWDGQGCRCCPRWRYCSRHPHPLVGQAQGH